MFSPARPDQLLRLGFQYYVTGRWAMRCSYPISPNLFHHAVELIMKYQLLRTVPSASQAMEQRRLSRNPYGHNLHDQLWPDYKTEVGDRTLDRFDRVIATLDRWEAIRYAGFPNGLPTEMMLNASRAPGPQVASGRFDSYECAIGDIDELIAAMLRASSFNLNIITDQWLHNPEVRRAYQEDNSSSLIPIPNAPPAPELRWVGRVARRISAYLTAARNLLSRRGN